MISTPRNIPNQCRRFLWILARRVWGQWVLTGCSPSADLTVPQPGRVRQWGVGGDTAPAHALGSSYYSRDKPINLMDIPEPTNLMEIPKRQKFNGYTQTNQLNGYTHKDGYTETNQFNAYNQKTKLNGYNSKR
ncbi:hypothetical protein CEXT_424771 [Caerostris extrusa]|uniref:Uncharacterized protein n=1 Tax=Caerostris extrusa TaxID=172846 RepID=A0AAV4XZN5_CAEEX|nr:hypothetical protein CEXT_424771 [Caerostris extrusa]